MIVEARNWRLISPYCGSNLGILSSSNHGFQKLDPIPWFLWSICTSDILAQPNHHGFHTHAWYHQHVLHDVYIKVHKKSVSSNTMMSLPSNNCAKYAPTAGNICSFFPLTNLTFVKIDIVARSTSQSVSASILNPNMKTQSLVVIRSLLWHNCNSGSSIAHLTDATQIVMICHFVSGQSGNLFRFRFL